MSYFQDVDIVDPSVEYSIGLIPTTASTRITQHTGIFTIQDRVKLEVSKILTVNFSVKASDASNLIEYLSGLVLDNHNPFMLALSLLIAYELLNQKEITPSKFKKVYNKFRPRVEEEIRSNRSATSRGQEKDEQLVRDNYEVQAFNYLIFLVTNVPSFESLKPKDMP